MNATIIVTTPIGVKKVNIANVISHCIDDNGNLVLDVSSHPERTLTLGTVYFAAGKWVECWLGEVQPVEDALAKGWSWSG